MREMVVEAFENISAKAQSYRLRADALMKDGMEEWALTLIKQAKGLEEAMKIMIQALENAPFSVTLKQIYYDHFKTVKQVLGDGS